MNVRVALTAMSRPARPPGRAVHAMAVIARYQQHTVPSRDSVEQSLAEALAKVQAG
jgi:hypothetical protein